MGFLLAEPRYLTAAERTLRAAWPVLERYPHGHTTLAMALDELIQGAGALMEEAAAQVYGVFGANRPG